MSEIIPFLGQELFTTAKEYGRKRVASILSQLSFIIFPSLFWTEIYILSGKSFFVPSWNITTGIVGFLAIGAVILQILVTFWVFGYIASQRETFIRRLQDSLSNEKERKSVVESFQYFPFMANLASSSVAGAHTRTSWGRVIQALQLPTAFLEIALSYFFAAILITCNGWAVQILTSLYEQAWQALHIAQPTLLVLAFVLVILLILSLCMLIPRFLYHIRLRKELQLQTKRHTYIIPLLTAFSIPSSFAYAVSILVAAIRLSSPNRVLQVNYEPFIISPTQFPKIVQKSFENAQGKECIVSEHKCEMGSIEDIDVLKSETKTYLRFPPITDVEPTEAIKMIARSKAVFYLGFVQEQCGFFGWIWYSPVYKARIGSFNFANRYVLEEFKAIIQKEKNKAREIA